MADAYLRYCKKRRSARPCNKRAKSYQQPARRTPKTSSTESLNFLQHVYPLFNSPIYGHLIPSNGGTRAQFGEPSFEPGRIISHRQHCHQLAPTTIPSSQPTSHAPVDPQLTYNHSGTYTPAFPATANSTTNNIRVDSLGDFKAASIQNTLPTIQKARRSSNIMAVGSGRPSASGLQLNRSYQCRMSEEQAENLARPLKTKTIPHCHWYVSITSSLSSHMRIYHLSLKLYPIQKNGVLQREIYDRKSTEST